MIKGRYVAQVTIDYEVKEDMPGLLPFETLKDVVQNQTTDAIKAMLEDEMGEVGKITVEQQYADLWKTED
ncbi:hypothetical protein PNE00_15050 [Flavonifractor plautii]|mgnify:FL=1|jgi:hypothetical protein|nr:hypothetical protein [Flavonifractor plautii]